MPQLRLATGLETDSPFTWVVSSDIERLSLNLNNIIDSEKSYYQNRLCYQTSDNAIWELTDYTQMIWTRLNSKDLQAEWTNVKFASTTNVSLTAIKDVYCIVMNDKIYKQTAGTGNFVAITTDTKLWRGIAFDPNGDIYASVSGGDIWVMYKGTSIFVPTYSLILNWFGMCSSPNGNIYACVDGGDIYLKTAISNVFVPLAQTSRAWRGMCSHKNGDIYACVENGDIYKQTAGTGNFVALNQTVRVWTGLCSTISGDVYACVFGGDIYKQTAGTGNFVALSQTTRNWTGLTSNSAGDVYCSNKGATFDGDIYKQTAGTGNFVALSQTLRGWYLMCSDVNGIDSNIPNVGDRVLLTQQTLLKENGLYEVGSTKNLARATDANTVAEINRRFAVPTSGLRNIGVFFETLTQISTLDVDSIVINKNNYILDSEKAYWNSKNNLPRTGLSAPTTATSGFIGDVIVDTNLNYWTLKYIESNLYYWSPEGFPAVNTPYFDYFDKSKNKKIYKISSSAITLSTSGTATTITTAHGQTMAGIVKFDWQWYNTSASVSMFNGNRYNATTTIMYAVVNASNYIVYQTWALTAGYSAFFQVWFWY